MVRLQEMVQLHNIKIIFKERISAPFLRTVEDACPYEVSLCLDGGDCGDLREGRKMVRFCVIFKGFCGFCKQLLTIIERCDIMFVTNADGLTWKC